MFQTYHDKLIEIENLYNSKDYDAAIVEGAKLTEKAVSVFFNQFHSFLTRKEDWNKYLLFEKSQGEKYANFLRKPTIGVAIGYYNQLLELFNDQVGLNQNIRRHLNTINQVRNAHVHSTSTKATDEDAASLLDAVEKILEATNLLKVSVNVIGVPIKYYLVFKSIREKFEHAAGEDDFRKIVLDSVKILPELLNNFLNKLYRDLPMEAKEKLTELYNATADKKKDDPLSYYIKLCLGIGIEELIEGGQALKDNLESILGDKREQFNRRQTRHYVSALEIVAERSDNPETRHFLEFSDVVKKRYLVKHSLNERDRIVLEEKASELNISRDLAERMEESVIRTIEKELILFQTLTIEITSAAGAKENGRVAGKGELLGKYKIAASVALVIVALGATWLLMRKNTSFTDYEEAYFRNDLSNAESLARKNRSLDNISANCIYLQATQGLNFKIANEIKIEYQQLLKKNPGSGPAHLYLGLIYLLDYKWREENDSSWLLIKRAEDLGVHGIELTLIKENYFSYWVPAEYCAQTLRELESYNDPRAKQVAAGNYLYRKHDSVRSRQLYQEAIKVYPQFQYAYISLAKRAGGEKKFDTASYYLSKARAINPESEPLLYCQAEVNRAEGKYDAMKKLYRDAIKSYASDLREVYYDLAYLLQDADSVYQGLRFIDSALIKFPRDRSLLNLRKNMLDRKEQLKKVATRKTTITIPWEESLEKALVSAKSDGKPVLFYAFATWSFWSQKLDNTFFVDSAIVQQVRQYIPVKVNGQVMYPELTRRFHLRNLPALLILAPDGTVITNLEKFGSKRELMEGLNKGIADKQQMEDASDPTKRFTVVNNLEDARIIARSKNMPIMILVGDTRSAATKQTIEESFKHPLFKPASENTVYLYLEKNSDDPILRSLDVRTYPSIFFLKPDGKVIYQLYGYQPGEDLAATITEVKKAYAKHVFSIPARINWFSTLQEAKTYSLLTRKKIYLYFNAHNCSDCELMNETYQSPEIISRLSDAYVCLKMNFDSKEGGELYDQMNTWYMPSHFILDENGTSLFSNSGYMSKTKMMDWLNIEERLKLATSLGYDRYKELTLENSLASSLISQQRYQSALDILLKEKEIVPDNQEILQEIATCYLRLHNGEEALKYHEGALNNGMILSALITRDIIDDFVISRRLDKAKLWFDQQIARSRKKENTAFLQLAQSKTEEYLGNPVAALASAKNAVNSNPESLDTYYQAIRMAMWGDQPAEAEQLIQAGQKIESKNGRLLFYKAQLLEKRGERQASQSLYTQASDVLVNFRDDLRPQHLFEVTNAYTYPGIMNALERACLDATKANPSDFFGYHILAHKYLLDGDLERALEYVNKTMEYSADPDNKMVKGLILYRQHKMEDAAPLITESEDTFLEVNYGPYDFVAIALRDLYLNRKEDAKKQLLKASTWRDVTGIDGYYKKMAAEMLTQIN